ncbi:MAG: polysaccharide biosynthesis protein [Myxococcales bacterium]|nr:polysaccharide biosynthesis protein [Myxococcales bacterium]
MSEPQETSGDAQAVAQQTRRGVSWSFTGAVVTNAMRVGVLAVLGRELTSTDFGVVAAAISVNAIVYGVRDIGLGSALVQRKDLLPAHLTTAFAASIYLGLALATCLFLAAPLIGAAYKIEESVNVIRVLAVLFFGLRSIGTTSRMMCQRAMNFRFIAMADAMSFTLGSIVSITAALAGAGPWALVAGYVVEETVSVGMFLVHTPPTISFRIDRDRLRDLLTFGFGQTITQSAVIVASFGDNLVVGNALGPRSLGFYTRAYDLIKFPSMVFDAVVGNVLFPAFAKLQHDRPNLALNFRRVAFVNALVLLPASAALIVLAPEAIRILMGAGWDDAVIPFQILAVSILMRTNMKLGMILSQAAGAVNGVAVASLIYMALVVGGAMVAVQWGIIGVAVSTAFAISVMAVHCCILAMVVSGMRWRTFFTAHVPGLLLAGVVTAITWPAAEALRARGFHAPFVFAGVGVAAIVVCLIGVAIGVRSKRGEFVWLGSELGRLRRRKAAP